MSAETIAAGLSAKALQQLAALDDRRLKAGDKLAVELLSRGLAEELPGGVAQITPFGRDVRRAADKADAATTHQLL